MARRRKLLAKPILENTARRVQSRPRCGLRQAQFGTPTFQPSTACSRQHALTPERKIEPESIRNFSLVWPPAADTTLRRCHRRTAHDSSRRNISRSGNTLPRAYCRNRYCRGSPARKPPLRSSVVPQLSFRQVRSGQRHRCAVHVLSVSRSLPWPRPRHTAAARGKRKSDGNGVRFSFRSTS